MTISLAEALAWTERSFDQQIARALDQGELVLVDNGATAEEVASFRAEYAIKYEEWKAASMAEIARSLQDWSAPSGKLQ